MNPAVPSAARVRGVLLDVDGTLIDSNDAHARAWVETFRAFGYDVPFERVRPLIGMGGDQLVPRITGLEPDDERIEALTKERQDRFLASHLGDVQAFRGSHALLTCLRDRGLRLVVATSANARELEALLSHTRLESLLPERTSSSDAEASKPEPDIVRAALQRGALSSAETVMLGDTPYDIEAAGRAGVPVVALRSGGWWRDEALAGAAAIYDDPADLLTRLEHSPLASRGVGASGDGAGSRSDSCVVQPALPRFEQDDRHNSNREGGAR